MSKTAQLPAVRVSRELRDFLTQCAEAERRSLSDFIRILLEDYRKSQRRTPEEIEADEDRAAFTE